ncbi:MAG: ADP-ribosylglycohydrolase family protein [Desulfosarcinaceae bacterium]|nr:ADP-ribosylglycohydrolase family protein [Desulfosarcinaceae bacterium]
MGDPAAIQLADRMRGAILGLFIGDALAMPVHWYYNRLALGQDYGRVTDYTAPRNPHPDSILWRSRYQPNAPEANILHDQAVYWGKPGVHYHQFLSAGENTLNLKVCRLLIDSLNTCRGYDQADFIERYIRFMRDPRSHRDTYVEEYHRNWFLNYGAGRPPENCGSEEKHISGLIGTVPILLAYAHKPEAGHQAALHHLGLTHGGERMRAAGALWIDLLQAVLTGEPLRDAVEERISQQANAFVGHPFGRWLQRSDEWVVGKAVSSACYVEDALPAILFLAMRYHRRLEEGLVANTNLGGDNAGRGALLGAILGAENGTAQIPRRWIEGLLQPPAVPDFIGAAVG